jgi:hypothetical protein
MGLADEEFPSAPVVAGRENQKHPHLWVGRLRNWYAARAQASFQRW